MSHREIFFLKVCFGWFKSFERRKHGSSILDLYSKESVFEYAVFCTLCNTLAVSL